MKYLTQANDCPTPCGGAGGGGGSWPTVCMCRSQLSALLLESDGVAGGHRERVLL
jgi:hypothetical protein